MLLRYGPAFREQRQYYLTKWRLRLCRRPLQTDADFPEDEPWLAHNVLDACERALEAPAPPPFRSDCPGLRQFQARLEPVSSLAHNFPQYPFAPPAGSAPSPNLHLPVPSLPRATSPALPQLPLCPAP